MIAQEVALEWRVVPGFPDYSVSELGEVLSTRRGKPRVLKPDVDKGGHCRVDLTSPDGNAKTCKVHQLVMLSFVGPRPDGLLVRHLDGNPANNTAANLAYGTYSENALDMVRHGMRPNQRHPECLRGHPYDEANTRWGKGRGGRLRRDCRTCRRDRKRAARMASRNARKAVE